MYLGKFVGERELQHIVGHAILGHIHVSGLCSHLTAVQVVQGGCQTVALERLIGVVGHRDGILEIVKLGMDRLQRVHGVIERCCRLQRPVPLAGANLLVGTVVVPEEQTRAETVAVVQLILIPALPDTLRVHSTHELGLLAVVLDSSGLAVLVNHIGVEGSHKVETATIHVVPHILVDGPEVFGGHHLTERLVNGQCRSTVLGVETVNAASAVRGGILVVAHGVNLLVGTTVVYTVALALHLVGAGAVQTGNEVVGAAHFRALVRRDVESKRSVVAYALNSRLDVEQVESLVVWMAGVASKPELLPD